VDAARIVAFDAFVQNMDRTAKNPNLLWSGGQLWLIDHGAALYWQHDWDGGLAGSDASFPLSARHVLLPRAGSVTEQAAWLQGGLTDEAIAEAVAGVPDGWWVAAAGAVGGRVPGGVRGAAAGASRRSAVTSRRPNVPGARGLIMRSCGWCRGSSSRNF
jgi:hypothetical protein